MNAEKSAELYARAVGLMPGGVNSPVRAMGSIGRDPIFVERAEGNRVWDVDGNEYVDWVSSWGPLILGAVDEDRVAADRAHRPDRRVDTARHQPDCPGVELCGLGVADRDRHQACLRSHSLKSSVK